MTHAGNDALQCVIAKCVNIFGQIASGSVRSGYDGLEILKLLPFEIPSCGNYLHAHNNGFGSITDREDAELCTSDRGQNVFGVEIHSY